MSFDLPVTYQYAASIYYALSFTSRQAVIAVSDDGAGNLQFSDGGINRLCGTINYATGALGFALSVSDDDVAGPVLTYIGPSSYIQQAWSPAVISARSN